ncbi:hypothetical protein AB0F72_29215 [Actinoplanes sp. NPDC023936]|uniref:hypothetical protein n=1 Tax=Actinoplanes sp. NPDC023936 TaxID=3154910 RepID=UPI0033D044B9
MVTSDGASRPAGSESSGGVPSGTMPGGSGLKSGRLRSRRVRLLLALTAGVMGLLCLGGAGIFFVLYDDATEIERTAPDAVVDSFLGAYLVNRDDEEAALYRCGSGNFDMLQSFREDTQNREIEHSVGISTTWSSLDVKIVGDKGTVEADLTRTIAKQAGRDSSSWRFDVVEQNGWRVCGATRIY